MGTFHGMRRARVLACLAAVSIAALVSSGEYTGPENRDLDFGGTNLRLVADGPPGLVVIDCESLGRGFVFQSSENSTSEVEGFTITNGMAEDFGGGLYCDGASPVFRGCLFTGNHAGTSGTNGSGGAVMNYQSSLKLIDCIFENNTAYDGAAVFCWHSTAEITACGFFDNHADHGGGGVRILYGSPVLTNVTIADNSAPIYGGGAFCCYSSPIFTNCTFWRNGALRGGGIYGFDASPTFTNCIIAGSPQGSAVYCPGSGSFTMTSCCVFENAAGDTLCGKTSGSFYGDPLFCDGDSRELWIEACSPCAGAGQGGADIGAWEAACSCGTSAGIDAASTTDVVVRVVPNPTTGPARIELDLPERAGRVEIGVYDLRGRLVRRLQAEPTAAGTRTIYWDTTDGRGRPVPSGVYFVVCETGASSGRKVVVVR